MSNEGIYKSILEKPSADLNDEKQRLEMLIDRANEDIIQENGNKQELASLQAQAEQKLELVRQRLGLK